MTRPGARGRAQLRPVSLEPGFVPYAEGSCLIRTGDTVVVCAATVSDDVPAWLRGRGLGWLEATYAMLPRASPQRIPREMSGRTQEIQRLIGRALRAAIDLGGYGARTVTIDCDVLRADGGTRTASITGGFVALAQALDGLERSGAIASSPLLRRVAAVSVGIVEGDARLDLDYAEDRAASVDMNVVMTDGSDFVEVQATAEHGVLPRAELDELLQLATKGVAALSAHQERALSRGPA